MNKIAHALACSSATIGALRKVRAHREQRTIVSQGHHRDFLDKGIEALLPMMINLVVEESSIPPSSVSRTVAKHCEDLKIPPTHMRRKRP